MPWFKFKKEVSHCTPKFDFVHYHEDDLPTDPINRKKWVRNRCSEWAEALPGGHNKGYSYDFGEEEPSLTYLKNLIEQKEREASKVEGELEFYQKELIRIHSKDLDVEHLTKTSLQALLDELLDVIPDHHCFTVFQTGSKVTIKLNDLGKGGNDQILKIYQGKSFAEVVQQALLYYIEGEDD